MNEDKYCAMFVAGTSDTSFPIEHKFTYIRWPFDFQWFQWYHEVEARSPTISHHGVHGLRECGQCPQGFLTFSRPSVSLLRSSSSRSEIPVFMKSFRLLSPPKIVILNSSSIGSEATCLSIAPQSSRFQQGFRNLNSMKKMWPWV